MFSNYILPLVVSFLIAFIATPIIRKIAIKIGAVDIPKDNRRMHKKPIPFLGGVAIYIATIIGILIFMPLKSSTTIAFILGGSLIMLTGLIDDFIDLSPRKKLLLQVVGAFILVIGGVTIKTLTYPFTASGSNKVIELSTGFSVLITIFWIVGITNTINLIDGLDGLSAGVTAISSITLMVVAYKLGYKQTVVISGILAGSALGFLPYNFNPAKIFMGDAGALFLGYMLSAISIEGVMKSSAAIAVVVPIMILGIPIFDTTFAICRRLAKGQHPMQADKGHLHHRLLRRGYSQRQTVMILYGISMLFGAIAISITKVNSRRSVELSLILFLAAIIFAVAIGRLEKKNEQAKDRESFNDKIKNDKKA